ncbi:SRPBCC family protein [Actinomycetospora soli]|uniref:SRPBCC family protein n=1 Tax=Actinomycetospora soli TaxID=2893887 RepID=UPI001E53CA55|nr:SRPBCC family protein [Actinomycetospora soli]MCD2191491.1 SRPBCC family protein [Actinomycetospora soli]
MQLENEFTVPVDIDTVFRALNDPEKVTPCFPGATLTSAEGDDFTGNVKVKLGPISMTYKGKGTFIERDETGHKVVVVAQGRDSRGNGTASAKATLTMVEAAPGNTKVTVLTEMQVTGKPAQFGRGVMADVGDKILDQFATCLADEFGQQSNASSAAGGNHPRASAGSAATSALPTAATTGASPAAAAAARGQGATAGTARPPREQAEALDLLEVSRGALINRLVPLGVAALVAIIVAVVVGRRSR